MKSKQDFIRNFCIIAHIDHGKSTLADRFIQKTGVVSDRDFNAAGGKQILDSMDIERERGITIKSQAVAMQYTAKDGNTYTLNLVDTPGHVDFTYEVSRAIQSCEGALLLVDASQGVEAQTLSNLYLAMEHDLHIIPVINKIDLPSADIDRIKQEIEDDLGLDSDLAVAISAKNGIGIEDLLEALIEQIPAPKALSEKPLKANIFDSHYDPYRGVIIHVRVFEGRLTKGQNILLMNTQAQYKVETTGIFRIKLEENEALEAGEVGYILAGVKSIGDLRVGDTITDLDNPCDAPLPGFKEVKPVVFSSIYPLSSDQYDELTEAMEKLRLNDAALVYEKDSAAALGVGFRCGFLGLLHLEVTQERIEREFNLGILLTSPSVRYRLTDKKGHTWMLDNPAKYPEPSQLELCEEPMIKATIITPTEYVGSLMALCMKKRGIQEQMIYLDTKRVELIFQMPLAEVLFDFYDSLKSLSRGYASFDYQESGFAPTDVVKMDILLNGEVVDALSQLVFRGNARERGLQICERLKEEIPKHQFKIAIQAAIGGTVVARETVSALRKDVTAKCYGGDITRKKKLLERQKEGKKRLKMVGNVELPQSAFLAVLKSKGPQDS
ncbi:translation elongation factor 4 [Entomospira culicis]|uniref:Elongation factor 4 n=1 Tax=Entomospira culicis TaxID=2719989 RepID=A0A968GFT2_9SPIO|nr:translation elongation factor 4 [Entomospira culicis]NIZ19588.1 elongation factor 4 [Entomospira culicis]NIZ69507.1 elongation factor 4 [Entomospira culicis]WDI36622.1 translation elongation factor 4 [Entomospira culicis]WDI38250.1 translation elongation factor 4 [Entomospira culicis]